MLEKEFLSDEPSEILEEEFIDNDDIKEEAKELISDVEEVDTELEEEK